MKKLFVFIGLVLLFAVSTLSCSASSDDKLPVADGGNADAAPADVEGELIEVTPSTLVIAKKGTADKIKVDITGDTEYFTAFGGFVRADELLSGQTVWVWYDERNSSREDLPKAKIIKVFSLDPNDKPEVEN
ncbi:MAG TPA: hypothetical protein VF268_16245 [Gammaproteobacteria bacterium]